MAHLLFSLLSLAHLVAGASSNSTSTDCSPSDGTFGTRSVWSILGSCALTLLICVWHALHPDVPEPNQPWYEAIFKRLGFVILSFFAPELVVARAGEEWCKAYHRVKWFREKGYEWSRTHSYFVDMDGFSYRNDKGILIQIDSEKFLELCKEGKIADPFITERHIKALSKSDAVGKVIFTIQLFWFALQVVVRGSKGLAVTLVELDTVCMAVLACVYLYFWWDKPLRPNCPHIFCWTPEGKVYTPAQLSEAWKSEPSHLQNVVSFLFCIRKLQPVADGERVPTVDAEVDAERPRYSKPGWLTAMIECMDSDNVQVLSLFVTWLILGALHLIAWNFDFPTETEQRMWRIASVILAGSSPALLVVALFGSAIEDHDMDCLETLAGILAFLIGVSGIVSRALLVGLMLASLRALPCSANETVPWTSYFPHL